MHPWEDFPKGQRIYRVAKVKVGGVEREQVVHVCAALLKRLARREVEVARDFVHLDGAPHVAPFALLFAQVLHVRLLYALLHVLHVGEGPPLALVGLLHLVEPRWGGEHVIRARMCT